MAFRARPWRGGGVFQRPKYWGEVGNLLQFHPLMMVMVVLVKAEEAIVVVMLAGMTVVEMEV